MQVIQLQMVLLYTKSFSAQNWLCFRGNQKSSTIAISKDGIA